MDRPMVSRECLQELPFGRGESSNFAILAGGCHLAAVKRKGDVEHGPLVSTQAVNKAVLLDFDHYGIWGRAHGDLCQENPMTIRRKRKNMWGLSQVRDRESAATAGARIP